MRTLTMRELNRALLARQFLLERSTLPLVTTIERIGGLQTQYAPSGYIGLWSRKRNFRRDALTEALHQRRVIQGTLLRSTIHVVSPRDYWLFLAAIRQPRQDWWQRATRHQISERDMEAAVRIFREQLAKGPRRAHELKGILGERGLAVIRVRRRCPMARYGSRSAVWHVGSATRRHLWPGGIVDPTNRLYRVSWAGARHPPLSRRLRTRVYP